MVKTLRKDIFFNDIQLNLAKIIDQFNHYEQATCLLPWLYPGAGAAGYGTKRKQIKTSFD